MEPECSLPHSQVPANCFYLEADQSSAYTNTQLPEDSIITLSFHLRLGIPSGLFPSGFPTKILYTPIPCPYALLAPPISFFSILSPAQYWMRSTDHLAPRYAVSSIPPLPHPS